MSEKRGWTNGESFADVDLDKARKGPEPVEPGIYRAQTDDAIAEPSQAGKPMVTHKFTLLHRYGDSTVIGRAYRPDKIPMQKKTAFRWVAVCDALGIAPPKTSYPDDLEQWAFDLKAAGAGGFWVLIKGERYTDTKTGEERMGTAVDRYLSDEGVVEAAAALADYAAKQNGSSGPAIAAPVVVPAGNAEPTGPRRGRRGAEPAA